MVQSYKSSWAYRVGPGWGMSLSKYFDPMRVCIQKFFITLRATTHNVIVTFLQLIPFANTAAFFYSLLGWVSHCSWEGDNGEEISTRWRCVEKINHSCDSWFVLRNLQAGFSYIAILESFIYAYSAIVGRFVIVSFFLRNVTFHSTIVTLLTIVYRPLSSTVLSSHIVTEKRYIPQYY